MSQPEEPIEGAAAAPGPPSAVPVAAIVSIALYALGMAGAAVLLLAGLSVLAVAAGWDAGTWSAAAAALAGGLALGQTMQRRWGAAAPSPGLLLGGLAAATGLAALIAAVLIAAVRPLHRALWPLLGGAGPVGWLLDFGLAVPLLLLPALCFAALPGAFSRLLGADRPHLYGYTLGATFAGLALGAAAGGTVLLPTLGVRGSLFLGLSLLGLAAGGTVLMRRFGIDAPGSLGARLAGRVAGEASPPAPAGRAPAAGAGPEDGATLAGALGAVLIGLSGWGMMVCWSRVAGLIAGPTGPVGATAMAVFLLGLGLGACGAAVLRPRRPAVALSILLAAAGVIGAATSFFVTWAAELYLGLVASVSGNGLFSFAAVLIALLLILPGASALGGALALLPGGQQGGGRATPLASGLPRRIGAILLGAALGDLLFRLALVPQFGLRRSLSAAAALSLLAAIVMLRSARQATPAARASGTLALIGLLIVVAGFPAGKLPLGHWDPRLVVSGSYRYGARGVERLGSVRDYLAGRRSTTPVFYREGRNATVMVERRLQAGAGGGAVEVLQLTIDGRVVAGNLADLRTQILHAHLPLLLHGEVRKVLLAGYATGVTAGSLLTHPLESLLVVEEEPALFGIEPLFGPYSNRPLDDPRLSRAAASPRAWLRAGRRQYDAILLAAPAPWLPSDAALLTMEGYEEMKARLRPGGLVAQRIALSLVNARGAGSILRTFAASFEEVLLFQISPEDLLLIGSPAPLRLDDGRLRRQIAAHEAVVGDLSRALSVGPNELLMALRLGGEALRDLVGAGPVNRDDHSTAALEALRDLRIHDNQVLLGAIDSAGSDALLQVLVNYGEGTDNGAAFLYGLAKSYLGLAADPERAKAIAARLSTLGATARAAWVRGEARLQQADYDGALRQWEGILESDPDFLDALFSLGVFYLDRRDHFAADRYLGPAARLHPQASIVLYHHGRNLFYLERHGEAIEILERARRTAGGPGRYPLIDYLAGVSALRLQRSEAAERSLKAYLKWAYAQENLTVLEVEAHGRLAEVYEQQGEPLKGREERQKGMNLQIRMREFARQQTTPGALPGRAGAVLPNPRSRSAAGAAPAADPATPPESDGGANGS